MLTPEEERQLASETQQEKYRREKEDEMKKVFMFKYEAQGLKQCKDNANLMGQRQVKNVAEQDFLITHWNRETEAIARAGGHMTLDILRRFYNDEDLTEEAALQK